MNEIYIYPTDTVWGIGGNIFSKKAYKKINTIKRVQEAKPLSILFASIDDLFVYFDLKKLPDVDWLRKFFSFESTLAIPKKWSLKEIPSWITQKSPYVAIRCLEFDIIREIIKEVGDPITSTSLNLTGLPPIVDKEKALSFYNSLGDKEVKFFNHPSMVCSGHSSSIVSYDGGGNFNFLRRGHFAKELEKHCGLLST